MRSVSVGPALARNAVLLVLGGVLASCQTNGEPTPAALADASQESTPSSPLPMVPAEQATFRFDMIIGIPAVKADDLAKGIGMEARTRGLTLVRRDDPTASYRVLGSLSAVGGTGDTSVTYVWDIADASGRRVHRITGIELAGKSGADPWSGVSDAVLSTIAARTVEAIAAWIKGASSGEIGTAKAI